MRGKEFLNLVCDLNHRITPAYAGKRYSSTGSPSTSQGSPPPMRGKVYSPKPLSRYDGITPAYAGKSTGIIGRNEI